MADELIVVDSDNIDKTVEIAKEYADNVIIKIGKLNKRNNVVSKQD